MGAELDGPIRVANVADTSGVQVMPDDVEADVVMSSSGLGSCMGDADREISGNNSDALEHERKGSSPRFGNLD